MERASQTQNSGDNSRYRRWLRNALTYSVQNYNPLLPRKAQIEAVRWAFNLWEGATEFRFNALDDQSDADIKLYWINQADGDLAWANPPPNFNGQRFEDGSIWFNLDKQWHFGLSSDAEEPIDLLTICAHEIGHAIGIGHYCMFGVSLMSSPYTGSFRKVNQIDANCYRQLYSPNHEEDQCCSYFSEDEFTKDEY